MLQILCHDLENMLGASVKTKPIYRIDHIFNTKPYHSKHSDLQMEECCIASPINHTTIRSKYATATRETKGYVVSLYTSGHGFTAENNLHLQRGITPSPLSSLTISPLKGVNTDWNFESETKSTAQLALLQMCLKRQLFGCVVADPKLFQSRTVSTNRTIDDDRDGCIVSLSIPNPLGVGERDYLLLVNRPAKILYVGLHRSQ